MWVIACVDSLNVAEDDLGYVLKTDRNHSIFSICFDGDTAQRIAARMAARNPGMEVQVSSPDYGFHCAPPPPPIKKKWVGNEYLVDN
jgi:hypothetical protein